MKAETDNRPISQIHNAIDKHPIMHHSVTKMCRHVYISVTKLCTVGYGTGALWGLWNRSIKPSCIQAFSSVHYVHRLQLSLSLHALWSHATVFISINFIWVYSSLACGCRKVILQTFNLSLYDTPIKFVFIDTPIVNFNFFLFWIGMSARAYKICIHCVSPCFILEIFTVLHACDLFGHIIQGCLTGTRAIVWFPKSLGRNPEV